MNFFLIKITGIAGVLCGAAAFAMGVVYPTRVAVTASLATAGVLLLSVYSWRQFDSFRAFSRKRSTHAKLNAILMIVFLVFIVVLLNLIARQYYYRYDGSTTKGYTLAPQSVAAAGFVNRETQILYFGVEGTREYKRAEKLLESYRYLNKLIVFQLLDLDKSPLKAKEYGVTEYNTAVAVSGEKKAIGKGADEQNLTNLIIQATRKKVPVVRFLQGHQERSMDEKERSGYGLILKMLAGMGYRVERLALVEAGSVPSDTDLLIIAAPQADFSDDEFKLLEQYRSRGGNFFILVDSPGQAKRLLASFNLEISQYPLYDSQNVAGTDPSVPLVNKYYDHPITANFAKSTIFPGVFAVERINKAESDFVFDQLVRTTRYSWFEKDGNNVMEPEEHSGFDTIAGIVIHKQELTKAVVFGDSDFASNAYVSAAGNGNLFTNVVAWMCGDGALAAIAPAKLVFIPMYITEGQAGLVRLLAATGIPVCICLAGFAVWYRRKNL